MSIAAQARRIVFVLPGDLGDLTGGTVYDRHMVQGLRQRGWEVDVVSLSASFPWPDAAALADAASRIARLPDGALVVADGLAFGAMPAIALQHARRLRWVPLVHHPLAMETGLDAPQSRRLFETERQALAAALGVVVTSATTEGLLAAYGVSPMRIHVVEPGAEPAALATGSAGRAADEPLALLCVATLTPRKGHAVLLNALAGLQDRRWTLHCVGSTARDAATTASLRSLIAEHGLAARVHLHGELGADALEAMYARADAFVLASWYEGYGMVLAEALAHGLPIVSTTGGAIPGTVPDDAGVLVPPGDTSALRAALARLLDQPAWRATLAAGAYAARARLADWPTAVERFADALDRIERYALAATAAELAAEAMAKAAR